MVENIFSKHFFQTFFQNIFSKHFFKTFFQNIFDKQDCSHIFEREAIIWNVDIMTNIYIKVFLLWPRVIVNGLSVKGIDFVDLILSKLRNTLKAYSSCLKVNWNLIIILVCYIFDWKTKLILLWHFMRKNMFLVLN